MLSRVVPLYSNSLLYSLYLALCDLLVGSLQPDGSFVLLFAVALPGSYKGLLWSLFLRHRDAGYFVEQKLCGDRPFNILIKGHVPKFTCTTNPLSGRAL